MIDRTFAHFRVGAKLGEGGMGIVYAATDTRLLRDVALKVLPESLADDHDRRRRFLREARAAAAVNHPNIATIYEVGEVDGRVFLAMELVTGMTLRARMAEGLSRVEALRIATEIARGLAKAHEKGVVHRDLKPENVMLTHDGVAKILDFGLAKMRKPDAALRSMAAFVDTTPAATGLGQIMGTPAYMSPEQVERPADVDARSDVFSFGVMLYELLSGVRPFPGTTAIEIVYGLLHREPQALRVVCPDAPPELDAVVSRCLRKAREDRFASGQELLVALEWVPTGRQDAAGPVIVGAPAPGAGLAFEATGLADRPPPTPAAPLRRRRRLLRIGAAVALSCVIAGAAIGWRLRSGHASRRPVTIADLPIPRTTVPEARAEYMEGIQLLRDDSWARARGHFERAAELDPTMAQAHLRCAIISVYEPDKAAAHLAAAMGLRGQLDERDQALLDAIEPEIGRTVHDPAATIARLKAARDRFPFDAEIQSLLAWKLVNDPLEGSAQARRATELDPKDGQAWETLGRSLAIAGDTAGARAALDRCASLTAEATDCVGWLAILDGAIGRCAEMETEARRQADDGHLMGAQNLALAEVALDRPDGMLFDSIKRVVATYPRERRPLENVLETARLQAYRGRFDEALAGVEAFLRASDEGATIPLSPTSRLGAESLRIQVLIESGREPDAREASRAFMSHTDLSAPDSRRFFGEQLFWWIVRLSGTPLDPARRQWADESLRSGQSGAIPWLLGWAQPVTTSLEAKEAVAALSTDPRLSLPHGAEVLAQDQHRTNAYAGHVLLLAGRPADALPFLRLAAANCFALLEPIEHVRAFFDLGVALEETGATADACKAYGEVTARWGAASPGSITASGAEGARRRLRCSP